jgi:thiol-disulfide isomerase/thioredoxin
MHDSASDQTAVPLRRRSVVATVGALAALAGAGFAAWRLRPGEGALGAGVGPEATFWQQTFERPEGGELALAQFRGRRLVLNFWATWCPPCVAELPLLDGFYRAQQARGWAVVGLAIDQPSAVRAFLAQRPLSLPVGLAGFGGAELAKALGNATGGLPYTVVFDRDGAVLQRKMGKLSPDDLAAWAQLPVDASAR